MTFILMYLAGGVCLFGLFAGMHVSPTRSPRRALVFSAVWATIWPLVAGVFAFKAYLAARTYQRKAAPRKIEPPEYHTCLS